VKRYLLPQLVLLSVLAIGCTQQTPSEIAPVPSDGDLTVVGSFDWSVSDRFGLDSDDDGRLDMPNTVEYVLNLDPGSCADGCAEITPTFPVVLDASQVELVDTNSRSVPIDGYEWTLDGAGEVKLVAGESPQVVVELPEGSYATSLEIRGGGQIHTLVGAIEVSDILVAVIGDSFASGEGNPEIPGDPARWADDGLGDGSAQELAHDAAHRSSLAGPAQAALQLERSNPHSSVTFLFLAASGASIEEGMLGPGAMVATGDGERLALRPQIEELGELVGCGPGIKECQRSIDALLISAGGNDIGFSFTLGSLIVLDPGLVVNPIYTNLLDNLLAEVESQIDDLPIRFGDLAAEIDRLDPVDVYLMAYPNSSRVAAGGRVITCESVGGDLVFGLEIDRDELDVVTERILEPLNTSLESIAGDQGWMYVDDHVTAFSGHGYCGSDPYGGGAYAGSPFPDAVSLSSTADARWFRQSGDSVAIQGGGGVFSVDRLGTTGTFHPNEFGHQAYKDALLGALGYGS
jgi:hypothetical protein